MHKVSDIGMMKKIPVRAVVYRIADSACLILLCDLFSETSVLHISVYYRLRYLGVEMRPVCSDASVKAFSIQSLLHIPLCRIVSRTCHIVTAASESCIDLEEFIYSVSRIILDVKIGKTGISD